MPKQPQVTAGPDTILPASPMLRVHGATGGSASVLNGRYRGIATLLIVAMLPLQFLGINVATTKVDLSNIIFLLFAISIVVDGLHRPVTVGFQIFFSVLLIVQFSLFFTGQTPLPRFISGCSWIFSILVIYGWRRYIVINSRSCYLAVLAGTALLATVILFELLVLNNDRPAGTMAEPSSAGLVLLATAAGLLISGQWTQSKRERLAFLMVAVILVYISYIIHTTHILSFAMALLIAAAFARMLNASTVIINGGLLVGMYFVASADTHYISRVDVGDAASNLSLLAWLQGFDQMLTSLRSYPLTGAGLGATGSFKFQSEYSDFLFYSGIPDLNLLDAYSGFFRLTIEAGPVFMWGVTYAIWLRLRELWRNVKSGALPRTPAAKYQVFLFVFALTLIVGIMLKEPTFSRSQVVVAALLFFVVPLRVIGAPGKSLTTARLRDEEFAHD